MGILNVNVTAVSVYGIIRLYDCVRGNMARVPFRGASHQMWPESQVVVGGTESHAVTTRTYTLAR